jgi:hypothetical protein
LRYMGLTCTQRLFIQTEKSGKRGKQVINTNRAVHRLNCFTLIF